MYINDQCTHSIMEKEFCIKNITVTIKHTLEYVINVKQRIFTNNYGERVLQQKYQDKHFVVIIRGHICRFVPHGAELIMLIYLL